MSYLNTPSGIRKKSLTKIFVVEDADSKIKRVSYVHDAKALQAELNSVKKDDSINYFCTFSTQTAENLDIKKLIDQLKSKGGIQRKKLLELIDICENIFQNEPNMLKISSPVMIVGDIHGQFFDLLNIFQIHGFPTDKKFLFLGDYVDRGLFCIEVLTLLLVLKVKYQKHINLLRGNHQGKIMTMSFNFRLQCEKKYGIEIYQRFIDLFCKFPLCAVIDETYFAVHGGISPQIKQISELEKINRFVEIQNKGVICDLLWSDPSQNNVGDWETNNMRGCSYYYSKIQAKRFLKENKIKMIIRGHQVQIQGFNYQKSNTEQKLTLTIFSAPNYCDSYRNKGAVAYVHHNKIQIHRFTQVQHPYVPHNYMHGFDFTIPALCQLTGKIFLYLLKNKQRNRKSSIIDDKLIQQLNALQRIEAITHIFEDKFFQNQQLLKMNAKKYLVSQNLTKSYEMSYEIFNQKKQQDPEQKYPITQKFILDQPQVEIIQNHQDLLDQKILTPISLNIEQKDLVFGPKLQMTNNINKKFCVQQEDMQILGFRGQEP